MRVSSCVLSAFVAAAAFAGNAVGQQYPTKPIRFIVPMAPGGANDIMARGAAAYLSEHLGRTVIVDNRPGADGIIGTEVAARAAPDGYTLLMVSSAFTTNAAVRKLPYDPLKDFDWIAKLGLGPTVLAVGPTVPANNLKELLALARNKPGMVIASGGGFQHFGSALFKSLSGLDFTIVVYKGGALAMLDVLGGRAHMTVGSIPVWLPNIRAGKAKGLATGGAKRAAAFPELPTISEAGLPGYDASNWFAIAAPAGVPRAIVTQLNTAVASYLKSPETQKRYASMGAEIEIGTPEELRRMIPLDVAKWTKVAKEGGMVVQK